MAALERPPPFRHAGTTSCPALTVICLEQREREMDKTTAVQSEAQACARTLAHDETPFQQRSKDRQTTGLARTREFIVGDES